MGFTLLDTLSTDDDVPLAVGTFHAPMVIHWPVSLTNG